jgi:hypothetical protein
VIEWYVIIRQIVHILRVGEGYLKETALVILKLGLDPDHVVPVVMELILSIIRIIDI